MKDMVARPNNNQGNGNIKAHHTEEYLGMYDPFNNHISMPRLGLIEKRIRMDSDGDKAVAKNDSIP